MNELIAFVSELLLLLQSNKFTQQSLYEACVPWRP